MTIKKKFGLVIGGMASGGLVIGALTHELPLDITEVLGFVFGGAAVWLTVEENIWNWPVGVANSAFYVIVFLNSRLFADMTLQVVYILLGFLGWYWWIRGGNGKTTLLVSRTGRTTAFLLAALTIVATASLSLFLVRVNDAAPFPDALTTVLSLVAQFMLTRKLFENWFVWITADVIYIGLYIYKGLYLTSILYAIFMVMCIAGLRQWARSMHRSEPRPVEVRSVA